MTYTVQPNQTLMDITILATGTLENLFAVAVANNMAISDDLITGTVLLIPNGLTVDVNTQTFFNIRSIVIGSAGVTNVLHRMHDDEYDSLYD